MIRRTDFETVKKYLKDEVKEKKIILSKMGK